MSLAVAPSATATAIVCARSAAEIPVDTPVAASIERPCTAWSHIHQYQQLEQREAMYECENRPQAKELTEKEYSDYRAQPQDEQQQVHVYQRGIG